MDSIPMMSVDLIHKLDEVFPPFNPSPRMTMEDIMYRSGQRQVVEVLLLAIKAPEDDALGQPTIKGE